MANEAFVVAAVQMASGAHRETNWQAAERLIRRAAGAGARLIVLPEVFAWRGAAADEAAHRETIPGPTTMRLAGLAQELGAHLCLGSILEAIPGDPRAYNTSCLIAPSGEVVACYRKMHLFDIDLPGRVTVRESDTRAPGTDFIVAPTPLGPIGMSICYDLRFPELYRALSAAGAEILVVPSAFTRPTGEAHWDVLCRARAVENQCWVIAANQSGRSPHGFADYGHSLIVDPWGTVVARAPADAEETIVVATIDPAETARIRRELPCLQHRRVDLRR